jgi:uncharacterized protein (DUF2147 family)
VCIKLSLAALLCVGAFAASCETPKPRFKPGSPIQASIGDWQTAIGAVIRIEPCGSDAPQVSSADHSAPTLCLRVVKFSPNPPETIDRHNPNPALRNRPLCGVTIGYGFRQLDEYRLGDGRVYDPLSAHVYRGYMMPAGPDTLKLRGYILFTLLGRTETWHRVEAVDTCK